MSQEIEEKLGLATAGTQMHIRDPDRPVTIDCDRFRHGTSDMPSVAGSQADLSTGRAGTYLNILGRINRLAFKSGVKSKEFTKP
jgi:hypothetical protein